MDIYAIDLKSSKIFQHWYLNQIEAGVDPEQIISALVEIDTPVAMIRAASISYWSKSPNLKAILKQTLLSGNGTAAEISKGFTVYHRTIDLLQQGGPVMTARLLEMQGALELSQRMLSQLPQDDLNIEAQIGVLIPMTTIFLNLNSFGEAVQYASQALFLAESIEAPVSIARARTTLISCQVNSGQILTAIGLMQEDRLQAFRYDWKYIDLELSACLSRLGNFEEGSLVLDDFLSKSEGRFHQRGLEWQQRINAIWGRGGLSGEVLPTPRGSTPSVWITQIMRALIHAYATPREGKGIEERNQHFLEVLSICRAAQKNSQPIYPWQKLFSRWAQATAHLGRGELAHVASFLEDIGQVDKEWLDIRILLLGAGMELALTWAAPEDISVARFEHLLRGVFHDATQIRYASPIGLAQLLHRWHPNAAAYLALMPEPIAACAFASVSLLKLGLVNSTGEDISLAPVYAADLVFRSLDFDLRPDFNFVQTDPGSWRSKKKEVMFYHVKDALVWRMPVSAIKISYGLLKNQKEDYHEQARAILQTYGIRPQSTAVYNMNEELNRIEEAILGLTNGFLTPKGFAASLRAIH